MEGISTAARVLVSCIIFSFFVYGALKSRFRYSAWTTLLLFALITVFTMVITVCFFIKDSLFSHYSTWGIVLWFAVALALFGRAIKGSYLEILFFTLMLLNLYVNVAAVAKVLVIFLPSTFLSAYMYDLMAAGVLILYIPPLYILFCKLLKRIIELEVSRSFWKVIWIIPALTYLIFYFKFISDYWRYPVMVGTEDIIFVILWSFSTYAFFWVTLQMLYQACRWTAAREQVKGIESILRVQQEQYQYLLTQFESTARARHDWRHHLITINSFAESGDAEKMRSYVKNLIPEYEVDRDIVVCENHVVNVIMQHYISLSREKGVEMSIRLDVPEKIGIEDRDLCIIFGNLTENAVDACAAMKEGKRYVEVRSGMKGEQLVVAVQNTYSNEVHKEQGVYYSTKHEGVGVGISSVQNVADKYFGILKVEYDNKYFRANIFLNASIRK